MDAAAAPATPEQSLAQARSDMIAGKITAQEFGQQQERFYAGQAAATSPPPAPLPPDQAKVAIETLRQQRIDGKVTPADYAQQMAQLQAQAAGEAPPRFADPATDAQAAAEAPGQPQEYRFQNVPEGEQALAADTAVRQVLTDVGVPARFGGPLVDAMDKADQQYGNLAPEALSQQLGFVQATLRSAWGTEFDAKWQRIEGLLDAAAERSPLVQHFLTARRSAFADPQVMLYLDRIAESQANHSARK